jgi:hypothetical protein
MKRDIEMDDIPSKCSSKKTLAEAMERREIRMRERKLGFRTLIAIAMESLAEIERE